MNVTTIAPDLLQVVNAMKKEHQKELFEYLQFQIKSESTTEKYKKEAMDQIRKALKHKI